MAPRGYLAARDGRVEGYVLFTHQLGTHSFDENELIATDLVTLSAEASRTLLGMFANHRSTTGYVNVVGALDAGNVLAHPPRQAANLRHLLGLVFGGLVAVVGTFPQAALQVEDPVFLGDPPIVQSRPGPLGAPANLVVSLPGLGQQIEHGIALVGRQGVYPDDQFGEHRVEWIRGHLSPSVADPHRHPACGLYLQYNTPREAPATNRP